MSIDTAEIEFFKMIENRCAILFDIGCREDLDYAEIAPDMEMHLFEPNPKFYNKCYDKLQILNNPNVILNNFAIGSKNAILPYYEDAQSFIKRTTHFKSKSDPIDIPVIKLSVYLAGETIEKIDFLKMDVEGYECDILLDNVEFIKNHVKYVQFEYASTWLDNKDALSLKDIVSIFDNFNFYLLYDEKHPLFKENEYLLTQIINEEDFTIIEEYMRNAYGFNIVMIRKDLL